MFFKQLELSFKSEMFHGFKKDENNAYLYSMQIALSKSKLSGGWGR